MTFSQLFTWDTKRYSLEEWETECKRRHRVIATLNRLGDTLQECDDALSVLADEIGSDRWKKWDRKRMDTQMKIDEIKRHEAEWLRKGAPHLY